MTGPSRWCHSAPSGSLRDAPPHRVGPDGWPQLRALWRPCGQGQTLRPRALSCSVATQALLEIFLERVARIDRRINAVVVRDVARARARTAAADEALRRGELWGPLHGLPVTVAEEMAAAGLPRCCTEGDARGLAVAGLQDPASCVAVARLEAAGAIVFGKTHCGGGEREGRL